MEFIALKAQYKELKDEIDKNIHEVLDNGAFIQGEYVSIFEKQLADYIGVKHVVSCSDGTAALQLIYMANSIGAGDAVFCPDMTFIASIEPACLLGATPVFCDIEPGTYNIDPKSLEKQIKSVIVEGKLVPKAVVAVDFLGNPADFDAIREITDKYNLLLIEDAAQGTGASYKGKKCGSLGDIGATSFFPSKPLGCYGDGGAVYTNDDEMAEKLKSLRVHGRGVDKYHNIAIGINSRLDTLQAAILCAKLKHLPEEMEIRQKVAERYCASLSDIFDMPRITEESVSAFAQFSITLGSTLKEKGITRDECVEYLKKNDIPSIQYYPVPMHMLPVFQNVQNYSETFDNTVYYSRNHFGIPFSPYIALEEQNSVIDVLKKCIIKENKNVKKNT